MLNIKETAAYLGVSERQVMYERKAGNLTPVSIGRRRLFHINDLDAFIARRRKEGRRGS